MHPQPYIYWNDHHHLLDKGPSIMDDYFTKLGTYFKGILPIDNLILLRLKSLLSLGNNEYDLHAYGGLPQCLHKNFFFCSAFHKNFNREKMYLSVPKLECATSSISPMMLGRTLMLDLLSNKHYFMQMLKNIGTCLHLIRFIHYIIIHQRIPIVVIIFFFYTCI